MFSAIAFTLFFLETLQCVCIPKHSSKIHSENTKGIQFNTRGSEENLQILNNAYLTYGIGIDSPEILVGTYIHPAGYTLRHSCNPHYKLLKKRNKS